ncbi:LysR family transcriptional regulator [Staphylococcus haemolyticus]|uniref:LysR family transcriptional regulator n=1 Tax=Staphylococcus borealis TaxID=2742203 RepID=UPI000FF7E7B5|nr:LysR family transcriptional regulator [Staphylococcus borealis]MDM7881202.1 LysR family transcriptional regulator [Staphylococcus borealis]RIO91944.1 LysR family transcriptional regulator [Staphylococcus haemolyticus]
MNTKQLHIFKHFVEAQNENAVAEKLGITQPTVTFHLKNLSKECGLPLYFKKGKHFNLTEAGELLYRNATKMINLIEETTDMMDDFKQSKRGTLRVGASHAPIYSILPSTFKNYMHEHPNIDINLTVDTAPVIIDQVKNRKIDIAVIAEKGFNESELQVKRLHDNPLVLAMDKRHPLAQNKQCTIEDINNYRFIIHNVGSTRDSINEWRKKNFINLDVHMETNSISSILATIKDSNYLSLMSENAIRHHPNIISKQLPNAPTTSYISLVYRNDRHLTTIIQDFITLIYNAK